MSTVTRMSARGDRRVAPALTRYRVMAIVTGVMLVILTISFTLGFLGVDTGTVGATIAIAHGWIYVVYLVTVFDLWSRLRWPFGRFIALVLAGVVPIVSFIMEHRIVREVRAGGLVPSPGQRTGDDASSRYR